MIGFIIWVIGVPCSQGCTRNHEMAGRRSKEALGRNHHPAHKLDWNLCLLLLGKGKPASNTEISSSIIYRSKQTCIKNKGDRQQLSPSFQKLGRTLPKLFLIAFREIGR